MTQRLLKRKEVEQITTLSSASIYRLVASGDFPSQVQVSKRSVAWREEDVNEWLAQRISVSNKAA
jgi:prophage regulatory protein